MKIASVRIALSFMLVLFCTSKVGMIANSSSTNATPPNLEGVAQLPGGPVAYSPFKQSFTTTEGDPFIIAVSVDCPSRTPTDIEFELLPPTPNFVYLSPAYMCTTVAAVAKFISVIPQPGDAGKYEIKIRATPCYEALGSVLTFKLKVKKAS